MAMNAGGRGIRLRPLDVGDVLDETFQVYRRNFVPLIGRVRTLPATAGRSTRPRSFCQTQPS